MGSLPVVVAFAAQLRIRDVIDGLCPVDDRSELTHGKVIEALVANRLTSPEPLVRVQDWAGGYAVEEVFGVRPEQLNDDRVGRAVAVTGAVVVATLQMASERGDMDELRRLAAGGSADAVDQLVQLASEQGDAGELRRLAAAGSSDAADELAALTEGQDDAE